MMLARTRHGLTRPLLVLAALGATAATTGCGAITIESIGQGDGSGGGGGDTSGAGPGSGGQGPSTGGGGDGGTGGTTTLGEASLVVLHEGGAVTYPDAYAITDSTRPEMLHGLEGIPISAVQHGDDLIIATNPLSISHSRTYRFTDFAIDSSVRAPTNHADVTLEPTSATQSTGDLAVDAQGGLWMTTRWITLGTGLGTNTLRWAPSGNIAGPWNVYTPHVGVQSLVLFDANTAIGASATGLVYFHRASPPEHFFQSFPMPHLNTTYLDATSDSEHVYAVTPDCNVDTMCSSAGEVHSYALAGLEASIPLAIAKLPNNGRACSVHVEGELLFAGACAPHVPPAPNPRIHVFTLPLDNDESPLATIDTDERSPIDMVSLPAIEGGARTLFARTDTAVLVLRESELGDGVVFELVATLPYVATDIAVVRREVFGPEE